MAESDLSGAVLDGRYKVIEPIAEGAMGSVYRGERLKLGRAVAIKVMHQELPDELASKQRFEREAKLMALLEHPNCVSVIDYGLHDDKPFLVMDLVRGTSLIELLDKQGRVEMARAADIIKQVLSGLAHAHELGIVHRDIKPANIMISEKAGFGQQVRILDFGLARLTETSTKLTTGIVVGTPNYMAPEQCKGGNIDARTDLYACGVVLFEMLTGRKPFVADDPIQVVRKHLMEKPPTLASVEPNIDFGDLETVIAKALGKAPGDRYTSAVEMARAVDVAANKATKMSAAALFSRAVPETPGAPPGPQVATMSGWNVPADARPTDGSSSGAAPGPGPHADASAPGSAPHVAPASSLPPLPTAPPYVPPPSVSTGPSPVVSTGPSPVVPASDVANVSASSGAPDRSMAVPPTRPSGTPADRPISSLPFTKKQLAIAGGGLVGVILLIALVAGRSDDKKAGPKQPAVGSATAAGRAEPPEDPAPKTIERAKAMLASEEYASAVAILRRARKSYPDNAELAFLEGRAYFGQLYWSDGVQSFRDAIKLDDSYKENPELLKTVLKGFLTTPDVDTRITALMREIGPPFRPYLEETAADHPKKHLRARAKAELNAKPD